MSFFNWFASKTGKADIAKPVLQRPDEAARRAIGHGKAAAAPVPNGAAVGAEAKSRRHVRRERLYAAVREAMTRAGVLSASYKFKVLSLDPRGEQFMVMVDLGSEFDAQTARLVEIEKLVVQTALVRFHVQVNAVYWRVSEKPAVGKPAAAVVPTAQPAPAAPVSSPPMPQASAGAAGRPAAPRFDPILEDEVAAFKQALSTAAAPGPEAAPAEQEAGKSRPSRSRSYTLLTGFEDTEMHDDAAAAPALSTTQYGDLR